MRLMVPVCILSVMLVSSVWSTPPGRAFPGKEWERRSPAEVELASEQLDAIAAYLGGRGCIVRHGFLVYEWGDATRRGDVASAAKPWYSTFLFKAVEDGKVPGLDAHVADVEPRLAEINPDLDHKDRGMTFAHMANQTSCYGLQEKPGTAYAYNDWQMALFFDTLFLGVYGATWETVDDQVLHPGLTDVLQCEDTPSFMAFGTGNRPGRLAVSPRDFARFGYLYLNEGNWNGRQVISREHARQAVRSPLPNSIPRTSAHEAEMIPGQRTIGSNRIPDDQIDHQGGYSWLWWLNGVDREGRRYWADAPSDTFAALGHANGQRGMAVLPSLDVVISWNDTSLGKRPHRPHPLNEVLKLLMEAAKDAPMEGQVVVQPENPTWLARNEDKNGDGRLDPLFLCGPGDPEDFLYRGDRLSDGTRQGDQETTIARIRDSGANSLYFQIIRSHGGDGEASHNPFLDSDPAKGLDEDILAQWDRWLTATDEAGIVSLLFLYDDSARIWDTGDAVGPEESAFIQSIVNRLEHHRLLIWCVAEEYQERFSPARVREIARTTREADEHNHPIAVHKLDGLSFEEFADDPNIDQFAIQYNRPDAKVLHKGVVQTFRAAAGRYNLNLSEAEDHGFGEAARRRNWAAAMGGAYVMALGWTFDTPDTPSANDLKACGRLVRFFESTNFDQMQPRDDLAFAGTEYVLAAPGKGYILYKSSGRDGLGIRELPSGSYDFLWFDIVSGAEELWQSKAVKAGDAMWTPPESLGAEVAVWIRRVGDAKK